MGVGDAGRARDAGTDAGMCTRRAGTGLHDPPRRYDDHYDGSFLAGYGLFVLGVSSGFTVA